MEETVAVDPEMFLKEMQKEMLKKAAIKLAIVTAASIAVIVTVGLIYSKIQKDEENDPVENPEQ